MSSERLLLFRLYDCKPYSQWNPDMEDQTMKKTSSTLKRSMLLILIGILFCTNVAAYVDPATTSYVIQIVAGVVIACGTAVGIFWNKIKRKFKKEQKQTQPEIQQKNNAKGGVITASDLMSDDEKTE